MVGPARSVLVFVSATLLAHSSLALDRAALDRYLNQALATSKSPSISVAVLQNGKVTYARAVGMADLQNKVKATPKTVYRLGSITKTFTAAIIMQLIGEGKLSLEDNLAKLLPETPKAWGPVTVRQLLNHTSGIKSYTDVPLVMFNGTLMRSTKPAGILKLVESLPLDFPAGTKWSYNNTGYVLLGMIIESLDSRTYAESLKARILTPLKMTETYYTSERTIVPGRAQGYSPSGNSFVNSMYINLDWPYAAGSMESTAADLAKWDLALATDQVLPKAAREQMWTPTVIPGGTAPGYGFGFFVGDVNGQKSIGHGGGIHGFTTFWNSVPSRSISVIVLTNSDASNPDQIARELLFLADPKLKAAGPKPVKDTDPTATKFAREILESILAGTLDRKRLTPQFSQAFPPDLARTAAAQLNALGKLSDFALLDSQTTDGVTTRTYQAKLGNATLRMVMTVDKSGLIAGLAVRP